MAKQLNKLGSGRLVAVFAAALSLGVVGCEDEVMAPQPGPSATAGPKAAARPAARGRAGAAGAKGDAPSVPSNLPPLPTREFHERDFTETEANRDPFRSFKEIFIAQAQRKVVIQREVLADKFALDELKIVGIVTGGVPRVLLQDPRGIGWVIKVGDFVAKPEIVRAGGTTGTDVAVNWRLDRIRDNDAVFVREDPTRPDIPASTKVISLRTEAERNQEIRVGIRGGGEEPS